MQDTGGVTHPAGMHRHVDDLLLDLRRLTGVGMVQQKRTTAPLEALAAPVALLAFRRLAMPDNIGAWAMGTVQPLDDHGSPSLVLAVLSGYEGSRSTGLKHLPITQQFFSPLCPRGNHLFASSPCPVDTECCLEAIVITIGYVIQQGSKEGHTVGIEPREERGPSVWRKSWTNGYSPCLRLPRSFRPYRGGLAGAIPPGYPAPSCDDAHA